MSLRSFVYILVFLFSLPSFALNETTPLETAVVNFETKTAQAESALSIATPTSTAIPLLGLVGIASHTLMKLFASDQAFAYAVLGSSGFLYASIVTTFFGLIATGSLGFSWLSIKDQGDGFQIIAPFVDFECHITSPILYAPVNISCNRSASFALARGAKVLRETLWNFDDGHGAKKGNETLENYPLANPGTYKIQANIQDSVGNKGIGAFTLNVPDGSPKINYGFYFSNPYQSAPTNITFWSQPLQVLYPCAVSVDINWTLPYENMTVNDANQSYSFTREYTVPGTYHYKIQARDSSGRKATVQSSIDVETPNPIAKIKCELLNRYSDPCTYRLSSEGSDVNFPGRTLVSFYWSSQDPSINSRTGAGSVDGSIPLGHVYISTLSVRDSAGLESSATVSVSGGYSSSYCDCLN